MTNEGGRGGSHRVVREFGSCMGSGLLPFVYVLLTDCFVDSSCTGNCTWGGGAPEKAGVRVVGNGRP